MYCAVLTLMMSAMGGWVGLTGHGGATRAATLWTPRLGQCSSLLVISCSQNKTRMSTTPHTLQLSPLSAPPCCPPNPPHGLPLHLQATQACCLTRATTHPAAQIASRDCCCNCKTATALHHHTQTFSSPLGLTHSISASTPCCKCEAVFRL